MDRTVTAGLPAESVSTPSKLSALDPSAVFAIKSLLYPVVTVATLLVSLLIWGEPLYGQNFLLSVFAFLLVANIFDVAQLSRQPRDKLFLLVLFLIVRRWLLTMIVMTAVLHLSAADDRMAPGATLSKRGRQGD